MKKICAELSDAVDSLSFSEPITHVYNPLNYARDPVEKYLDMAGESKKEAIFLGMNPGPWGMAQTGVPFGEVQIVRSWLKIEERVKKPVYEHPKRPVLGFSCPRSEVSGKRLWGAIAGHFGTSDEFFKKARR